jgi:NAD(P)-dependent dehydrogenase (short-subunit alcohol dehydrogenase family)
MNLFNLSGKTALVTGGGRGLGKAIALALSEAGADVALTSRTRDELEEACREISEYSAKVFYQDMDIRDTDSMRSFIQRVVNEQGSIDILVNAAGINIRSSFLEMTESDWDMVMDVNLKSVFLTSQIVLPHMINRQSGKIINIASLSSKIGLKGMAAYCASKGGVSQLTKAMAVDFAEYGINVNAIGPGYFKTKLTEPVFNNSEKKDWVLSRIPMGKTGHPNDLAGAAVFLASTASDYITGQTIYVDGGWLSS